MQQTDSQIEGHPNNVAIIENYLVGLANEDQAVELLLRNISNAITIATDALTVLALQAPEYPPNVLLGLRRIHGRMLQEHTKAISEGTAKLEIRINSFIDQLNELIPEVNNTSTTSDYVPVIIVEDGELQE